MVKLSREIKERPEELKRTDFCEGCPCHKEMLSGLWVPPMYASSNTKLILVAEAPGKEEVETAVPLCGVTGRLFSGLLESLNIPKECVHKTNARLCPGFELTKKQQKKATQRCRYRLYHEIKSLKCSHIAALGAFALYSLCKRDTIKANVGDMLQGVAFDKKTRRQKKKREIFDLVSFKRFSVHPMFHPTYALIKNEAYRPVLKIHLDRAWRISQGLLERKSWPKCITHFDSPVEMLDALERISSRNLAISVDVETFGEGSPPRPIDCSVDLIGISDGIDAVAVPFDGENSGNFGEVQKRLFEILRSDIKKEYQNGAYDINTIYHRFGIDLLDSYHFDTLIAHSLVAPWLPHNLGFIAACEYPIERWKDRYNVGTLDRAVYNCKDCLTTSWLSKTLDERLKRLDWTKEYFPRKMESAKIAIKMYRRGVLVDKEVQQKHAKRIENNMESTKKAFEDVYKINAKSNKDLADLFFKKMKVRPLKYSETTGEPSLDASVLDRLQDHQNNIVADAASKLLIFRKWTKLYDSYISGIYLDQDNVFHEVYNVSSARTGRFGATKLMTIPRTNDGDPSLREMFVARPGNYLLKADYDQQELKAIAYLAGDQKLIKAFELGHDIHKIVASKIIPTAVKARKRPDQITKDERDLSKTAIYALAYGAEAVTVWAAMRKIFNKVPFKLAEQMCRLFRKEFHDIVAYQEEVIVRVKRDGFNMTPLSGRKQIYPNRIKVDAPKARNWEIQALGMDLAEPALHNIDEQINWGNEGIFNVLHDEIVLEGPDPHKLYDLLKTYMEQTVVLGGKPCKFTIECSIGHSWAGVKKVKNHKEIDKFMKG